MVQEMGGDDVNVDRKFIEKRKDSFRRFLDCPW